MPFGEHDLGQRAALGRRLLKQAEATFDVFGDAVAVQQRAAKPEEILGIAGTALRLQAGGPAGVIRLSGIGTLGLGMQRTGLPGSKRFGALFGHHAGAQHAEHLVRVPIAGVRGLPEQNLCLLERAVVGVVPFGKHQASAKAQRRAWSGSLGTPSPAWYRWASLAMASASPLLAPRRSAATAFGVMDSPCLRSGIRPLPRCREPSWRYPAPPFRTGACACGARS